MGYEYDSKRSIISLLLRLRDMYGEAYEKRLEVHRKEHRFTQYYKGKKAAVEYILESIREEEKEKKDKYPKTLFQNKEKEQDVQRDVITEMRKGSE